MSRFGNDRDLVKELVADFLKHIPEGIDGLAAAVAAGDAEKVKKNAHRIKGALATLSADKAFHIIKSIEDSARLGDLRGVPSLIEKFKAEMIRLKEIEKTL